MRYPFPEDFADQLDGTTIVKIDRRAKFLLLHLDSKMVWVAHLGMTGHFTAVPVAGDGAAGAEPKFLHFECVVMSDGRPVRVAYYDQRKFGYMLLVSEAELDAAAWYQDLGVEPFSAEFTAARLAEATRGRKTDIKSFLTDQKNVAGVGNAYVCEALWQAKVRPERPSQSLSSAETEAIVTGLKSVLTDAIAAGEASVDRAEPTAGRDGYFDYDYQVYDREGEPCPRGDGGVVERTASKGRSSFYCPVCQK